MKHGRRAGRQFLRPAASAREQMSGSAMWLRMAPGPRLIRRFPHPPARRSGSTRSAPATGTARYWRSPRSIKLRRPGAGVSAISARPPGATRTTPAPSSGTPNSTFSLIRCCERWLVRGGAGKDSPCRLIGTGLASVAEGRTLNATPVCWQAPGSYAQHLLVSLRSGAVTSVRLSSINARKSRGKHQGLGRSLFGATERRRKPRAGAGLARQCGGGSQPLCLHHALVAQRVGADVQLVNGRLHLFQARVAFLDPSLQIVTQSPQPLSFLARFRPRRCGPRSAASRRRPVGACG